MCTFPKKAKLIMNEQLTDSNGPSEKYQKARLIRKIQGSKKVQNELIGIREKLTLISTKTDFFINELAGNPKVWFRQQETSTKETVDNKRENAHCGENVTGEEHAMELERESSQESSLEDMFSDGAKEGYCLTRNSVGEEKDNERETEILNKTVPSSAFIFF